MTTPTTVQYYKYPDTPHWRHDLIRLGVDEYGVWLGASVGTRIQKGDDPPKHMAHPFVQLIAPNAWWTLIYNGDDHPKMSHYVDIITPAVWVEDDVVSMIDIDLDVVLEHDGLRIDDEDEFLEHQTILAYPPWLVAGARAPTAEVYLAIEARRAPFFGPSEHWLSRLQSG